MSAAYNESKMIWTLQTIADNGQWSNNQWVYIYSLISCSTPDMALHEISGIYVT